MNEVLSPIFLTYKYRVLPTKRQHGELAQILEDQRHLYNAALESRIDCYRKTGKALSYFSQCLHLTQLRQDTAYSSVSAFLQRATLRRLDSAYRGFFGRVKRGEKAGFPRFKGKGWWDSFGFAEFMGIRLVGNRLLFKGLSRGLRVHMHRRMPEQGKILACQFRRDAKGWSVSLQVRLPLCQQATVAGNAVGLDLGLSKLATLSSGDVIANPQVARRHRRLLRKCQRRLARCKKGSLGRGKVRKALARQHLRIKNSRTTYLHQVSAKLVRDNDVIAIENLNIKGLASGMLAKSVNDAGWGRLVQMLTYKAVRAGRQLIEVDARNTTQACSGCGVIVPKKLSDRWHECPHCGLSLDRDHNAAINILARSGAMSSQREALACA